MNDWLDVEIIPIGDLTPHPLNAEIYGDGPDEALVRSVRACGVLSPIITNQTLRVIAGHRRLLAANDAGLTHVPVIRRTFADDDAEIEALLDANLQREKTNEQMAREGRMRLPIEKKRAESRMKSGDPRQPVAEGKAVEIAATKVGRSGEWLRQAVAVLEEIDRRTAKGNAAGAQALAEKMNGSVKEAFGMLPKKGGGRKPKDEEGQADGKADQKEAEAVLQAFRDAPEEAKATEDDNDAFKAARDEAGPLEDALGQSIPAAFAPHFAAGERIEKLVNSIRACERELADICKDGHAAALKRRCKIKGDKGRAVLEYLEMAAYAVRASLPHTLCPRCWDAHPGEADPGCSTCDGSGVVCKEAFSKCEEQYRHPVANRDAIADGGSGGGQTPPARREGGAA